ncbi:MAG: hypothetical protein HOA57_00500 [Candidatus Magasanikbacteria bacterium]|nr:hypothetical protein [Candidatus Magasanikbacteria bacterium]
MTQFTAGGFTYSILDFLQKNEKSVTGREMVRRAMERNAHFGRDHGEHLWSYQEEIPVALQDLLLVFTGWRVPYRSDDVNFLFFDKSLRLGRWVKGWSQLDVGEWGKHVRLVGFKE